MTMMMKRLWHGSARSARRGFHTTASGAVTPAVAPQRSSVHHPASQWRRMTTLIYSSIIATAAAADVEIKHRRNEQWDKAIAVAEQDLSAYQASSRAGQEQHLLQEPNQAVELLVPVFELEKDATQDEQWVGADGTEGGRQEAVVLKKAMQRRGSEAVASERSSELGGLKADRNRGGNYMRDVADEVGDRLSPANLLDPKPLPFPRSLSVHGPNSMYASASYKSSLKTKEFSLKKTMTIEYSMAMLAAQFDRKAMLLRGCSSEAPPMKELQGQLEKFSETLKTLRRAEDEQMHTIERLQHPRYTRDPLRLGPDEAAQNLNRRLLGCFVKYRQRELTFSGLLSELARLLLTSSVTPNRFTFTLLLSRLRQSGHMDLASQVLTSIHDTKIRPDELLAGAILSHYTAAKDSVRFHRYVERLRGKKSIMLARPDIHVSRHVTSDRLCKKDDGNIWQMLSMSLPLFKIIITGYLKLNDLGKARSAYEWMEASGFEADHGLANAFLRCHVQRGRRADGIDAWRDIQERFMPRYRRYSAVSATLDERNSFLWASELFRACDSPQQLRQVEEMASSRGIDVSSLKPPRLPLPRRDKWFDHAYQGAKAWQREIERMAHKIHLFEVDIKRHALDILASKIILSGMPVSEVREMVGKLSRRSRAEEAEEKEAPPKGVRLIAPAAAPMSSSPQPSPGREVHVAGDGDGEGTLELEAAAG